MLLAPRSLTIIADQPGERLDVTVARLADISRAQAQRLISEGLVTQKGRTRHKPGDKLEGGEELLVAIPEAAEAVPLAEAIDLDVAYEDSHLIVVNKPAGMPVHPGPGHSSHTLVNALLGHCRDLSPIGGVMRPGIVHRLDKDTSGLIMAAKDEKAHLGLSAQLKERQIKKTYLALVEGKLEHAEAMIDAPIGRDPNNRRRMMARPSGTSQAREAQTIYKVRQALADFSLVEVTLVTGRTHQIRVHFASINHPVASDPVYGRPSKLVPRQFLHAWRLEFNHPITGAEIKLEAPLPPDLQAALQAVEALQQG